MSENSQLYHVETIATGSILCVGSEEYCGLQCNMANVVCDYERFKVAKHTTPELATPPIKPNKNKGEIMRIKLPERDKAPVLIPEKNEEDDSVKAKIKKYLQLTK